MAEQHNRPQPPTLDDYQAMMSDLRAPKQLREAVLKEARARRGGASTAATGKGPSRPSVFFRHHRARILVIAACAALLLGAGSTTTFVLAMTLFGLKTKSAADTRNLSGMVQSIGYLIAALGPVIIGNLNAQTHNWFASVAVILVAAFLFTLFGMLAERHQYI